MNEVFEKDFNDLSEETKRDFYDKYNEIKNIVINDIKI